MHGTAWFEREKMMAKVVWETIEQEKHGYSYHNLTRAKVPGGWLVKMQVGDMPSSLTFIPDPNHEWK